MGCERRYIVAAVWMLVLLCPYGYVMGKEKQVATHIHSWNLTSWTGEADTLPTIDSSYLNLPLRNKITDYSISMINNSNIVSPTQSRIWFDRKHSVDFLFADAYLPYIITPQQVRFYHTTTPFSSIAYKKGFVNSHEENDLSFMFTGNISRRTNLGMSIDYLNSYGRFADQQGKTVFGSVFGSYNGDHYSLHAAFTFNTLSNFENGGLQNPTDLQGTLNPEDMPTNMKGMSGFRYLSGLLNHQYSICTERERKIHYKELDEEGQWVKKDSSVTEYVPVTTFRHVLEVNDATKRYIEQTPDQGYYEYIHRSTTATHDTAACLTIQNTLSVTFEEEFNTWLKFGAIVYAMNECQRHTSAIGQEERIISTTEPMNNNTAQILSMSIHRMPDTLYGEYWTNNTFVGGALYKHRGKWIHYGFDGNVCLVGYKIGEFQVNGNVDLGFKLGKDSLTITANAYLKNVTPDFYCQYYRSNHYKWDNEFGKTLRLYAGGEVAYPMRWIKPKLKVGFENLTRYIYFSESGQPMQDEGNIQVLAMDLKLDFTSPWVNWDNDVVFQHATSDHLPLPMLTIYTNLYYHGTWFRALDAQIGVDLRYFTKYYAPLLNPALGQFCIQTKEQVGNYPLMNVYANFYVKTLHLNFFAEYQHFNASFMGKQYYEMPGYPMNPDQFRAGVRWHFLK